MNLGTCSDPQQNACTNPINSGTGNKHQHETDYVGTGIFPLRAERIYNSGAGLPSMVVSASWGNLWRGFYDRSIRYGTDNSTIKNAYIERPDGKTYIFRQAIGTATPPLTTTTWTPAANVEGALVATGVDANGIPTGWVYTNERDEVETYVVSNDGGGNPVGLLMSITNRAGQTQTLAYSNGNATGPNGGYVLDAAGNQTAAALPIGLLIRVTDPALRTLQFGYNTLNHVVKMTDPAGGVYLYAYDTNPSLVYHHIVGVTYPDGKTRTYLYGEAANVAVFSSYDESLTGILDENGNRYASWTYDAAGRATSSEHGAFGSLIDKVTLSYAAPDINGNITATTVTDVSGTARTYNFSTMLGVVKTTGITGVNGLAVQPCNGCAAAIAFNPNGKVAARTDFNGNTVCRDYDLARNLETTRVEGLVSPTCPAPLSTYTPSIAVGSVERKITTQWHTAFRLPVVVAEPLRITRYVYNGDLVGTTAVICGYKADGITLVPSVLCRKTIQPTTDTTGGLGVAAATTGTPPRITNYTYNAAGQVLTVDGPRTDLADITTYTYDAQGNLSTVKNALNQTTTIDQYDANGRPGRITDPNGLITNLIYDARGRLTSRSAGGETTSYQYDGAGNLTHVALPSGAAYIYTYDAAHRLTRITEDQGATQSNYVDYALDTAGNRTLERLYSAIQGTFVQTHSRVFDNLNRLWKDIGAINNETTVYAYYANGNLQTVTDPLNRTTTNTYDALNRLNQVTNPDTGIIHYGYDGQDQLIKVTDPKNLSTQYTRDGLGNLPQQASPDTGATGATYDAAGNVLTRTDAKGQTATYTWDALNRIHTITYSGGAAPSQSIAYQYDVGTNGIGHLTQITDSTGITSYAYDVHGRLTTETEQAYGAVYTTGYGYDAQGRLASITYPSGRIVNYTFDAQGRINQIASTANGTTKVLASAIIYEPFGGIHSFTYGDGLTTPVQTYTRNRDMDGRIGNYTLSNGRTMTINYDYASQIRTIYDSQNLPNPASYFYDPMSRLTSYIQGATNQGFNYDVDGNRTSQTIGTTTTNYTYPPGSNWLTSIQVGAGAAQPLSHDLNGATTVDATRQYAYDLRGRLIQATTALGIVNYEVNALGLRVRKQVPYANTDTLYHYDLQGHLIVEHSNGGATPSTREYIYLGDQPIAVLK